MTAQGLIVQDNRFLMVKQQKHGRIFWNFPGGHIEEGESPEEACIREIEEETGYRVAIQQLVYATPTKYSFTAAIISGTMKLEDKLLDIAWVSEQEADKWDGKTLKVLEQYKAFMSKRG
ncbi:NUDIX domain-containing protein [Paenibacillus mesophilus]|uniref:NUDIX hydrolase n=1 Tax=Paenibacillus mesophilus TaxID=2582849 RepID=UPI00110E9E72|nr:NUDIX domain-containing protein [Paenibacillus mesophilus]TMV50320.1 NUDIX domain-containing protein [Paenibacillus mesophilus]